MSMGSPFAVRRRRRAWQIAAVLVTAAAVLVGCTTGVRGKPLTTGSAGPSGTGVPSGRHTISPSAPSTGQVDTHGTSASPKPTAKPVHIQLKFSDGQTLGVGIPVIAFFSKKITDATALQDATTVTIKGSKVTGGRWYFEPVSGHPGYPIEGDYRLENPWRAHSKIFVDIPAKGLSAGAGLAYDDSLTWTFSTGASHVALVDNTTHTLTLTTDGKTEGTYPVSLGAPDTPTVRGTTVIMEKGVSICMSGPGYNECGVRYTQRLTYGGDYLHSAPWNCTDAPGCVGPGNDIGHGDSSNGCTNLLPNDAKKLYGILRIGDIVKFPNADGPKMTMGAGYGDWNVQWPQWLTGGDVQQI